MAAKKKSSKASSPSWRTLRRQAAYAVSEAHKEKLLKESNRLRRAERAKAKTAAKAGPKKRTRKAVPAKGQVAEMNRLLLGNQNTTMRGAQGGQGGPVVQAQGWSPQPTHEEQVAQNRADEITKLARSRGGAKEQIAMRLACWNRIAEVEARKEAEVANLDSIKMLTKQMHINVVASFICAANGLAKANGGPMPRSTVISGYVLARVIDALTQAGYTEDGFKSDGIRRLDRESVVNEMVANRTRR